MSLILFLLFFGQSKGQEIDGTALLPVDTEALMTVPEIIRYYGYPVEEHRVITEDGYILTIHRIPHGRNDNSTKQRPIVFLQHGLLCSSSMWVLNPPEQSAGFLFADAGFDVWMGNSRGNVYAKKHTTLQPDSDQFWRFSWEEMARYDLQSSIDGILKFTKQPHLYYVGHSQGTLTMFVKQATDPLFGQKIRKAFMLAPVGRLAHVKGLFHYLGNMYEQFKGLLSLLGDSQFFPNNLLTRVLADLLCDSRLSPSCTNLIFMVSGPDSKQLNTTRIPIYLAHNPAGTSMRNMVHFAQLVRQKVTTPYDLGARLNYKVYGQASPPEYDFSGVSSPTYLFYSDTDWLATEEDVTEFLIPQLNQSVLRVATRLTGFNHNDFMWGLRARKEIYDPIANIIRQDARRQRIEALLMKRKKMTRGFKRSTHKRRSNKGISMRKAAFSAKIANPEITKDEIPTLLGGADQDDNSTIIGARDNVTATTLNTTFLPKVSTNGSFSSLLNFFL